MVTLAFATTNELLINKKILKTIFNFIPKASLLIYIDADYDVFLSRGHVDEGIDFIQFQRKFYSELARKFDAIVIDTSNRTKAEVNQSILQYGTNISQ